MTDTVKTLLRQEQERYKIPKGVQDLIPIDCLWKDGIFRSGQKYSKCYYFSDINYTSAAIGEKERMFGQWCSILNSLGSEATAKITVRTRKLNRLDFEARVLFPLKGDERDEWREEYNSVLRDQVSGESGLMQDRYLTISVAKQNVTDARRFYGRLETDLKARFKAMGSRCVAMDAEERLEVLHNFYRPEESDYYHFDLDDNMARGHSFKDYICPDSAEQQSEYLKLGNRYVRVLYLKDIASSVFDSFVMDLASLSSDMTFSADIITIPPAEAKKKLERVQDSLQKDIADYQRKQNQHGNYAVDVPYQLAARLERTRAFADGLQKKDQKMMQVSITCMIGADSLEQLGMDTDSIRSFAASQGHQLAVAAFQQRQGLSTALPIGPIQLKNFRTLTTEGTAAFMPFNVQEIQDREGIYLGQNAISHNLILANRSLLQNQGGFIFGVPGSGKSMMAKQQIAAILMSTDDDVLVCDPEGEYGAVVQAIAGEDSAILRISASRTDRINVMEFEPPDEKTPKPANVKSQFIMSLLERINPGAPLDAPAKSIIDRCVQELYEDWITGGKMPTLSDLRQLLMEQSEDAGKALALALELYTTGSLNIFGGESNVDMNKRAIVFDIKELGAQLKSTGLLVVTDTMLNRVMQNRARGQRTHVFIDEFHVMFEHEESAKFLDTAWRQFRKYQAPVTGITQNVSYLIKRTEGKDMLSNSEFTIMLNQAASDREELGRLLGISDDQMAYITDAPEGCGLIRYGNTLVPFENHWPSNTKLYSLMTTRPGEGIYARR